MDKNKSELIVNFLMSLEPKFATREQFAGEAFGRLEQQTKVEILKRFILNDPSLPFCGKKFLTEKEIDNEISSSVLDCLMEKIPEFAYKYFYVDPNDPGIQRIRDMLKE